MPRERGVLTLPDTAWAEAKYRKDIIAPLAEQAVIGSRAADKAAARLGVTRRQVYKAHSAILSPPIISEPFR